METVIVTGANRGIGLGLVKVYLASNARVIAACRNPALAHELNALGKDSALKILALDVADASSVARFVTDVGDVAVDILINNAGIIGGKRQSANDMDFAAWEEAFAVNTIAPFRLTTSLVKNLRKSPRPRVLSISSQMGSLAGEGSGYYAYRSSKAALNKVMSGLAKDLEPLGILVCPLHPGWVQTDMGGSNATITVSRSATGIHQLIANLTAAQSGHFLTWEGDELPW